MNEALIILNDMIKELYKAAKDFVSKNEMDGANFMLLKISVAEELKTKLKIAKQIKEEGAENGKG